jgi:hypothetical protein
MAAMWNTSSWLVAAVAAGTQERAAGLAELEQVQDSPLLQARHPTQLPLELAAMVQPR